ncbi:SDR family oxidoreductase [Epilithonimonas sp.]|uniref:SDR family oxidoreductase n=1 Tax=Epilithonimonas sp. TaxID=2894511 RepID=UPI0035B34661
MNVLITGISRGVGFEIAKLFLENGHRVYGISRTESDELKALERQYPDHLFFKNFDLSDPENIKQNIFKDFITNHIPIHVLINNAAMAYDDIVTNLNYPELKTMFDVNLYSPMFLTKYAIRNMIYNRISGSIIHISSISAHTGYKGLSMYAASKGALQSFSKNISREWGERGIRSNIVVPGYMETAMNAKLTQDHKNRIFKRTALKKETDMQSVAETVLFLAGEKSKSITGQEIFVDSGTL